MASFNKVILAGNLTRDPQMKYLPSNAAVTDFGLAVNRRYKSADGKDREDVAFVDCTAFGKTAEVINKFFIKGKPILIEGRLKYETWEDRQHGGKRSRLSVVVENFQFLGDGGGGKDRSPGGKSDRPRSADASNPFDGSDEPQFTEADIPF